MLSVRRFCLFLGFGLLLSLVAHEVHLSSLASFAASGGDAVETLYLSSNLWLPQLPPLLFGEESTTIPSDDKRKDLPVWKHNNPFFQTAQRDALCHGCRVHPENKHCASPRVLLPRHRGNNLSALEPSDLPEECQGCVQCPERDHWYGRFDEAAPPVQLAISHFLPSIPDIHRFPYNVSSWLEYFKTTGNAYPDRIYYAEYNPSIVRIPDHQIPQTFRDQGVVYLASFRVTTLNFCHPTDDVWLARLGLRDGWPGEGYLLPENKEYTGLALLGEDLNIVADAVFNLKPTIRISDARLFVLDNEIYISPGDSLFPIWLVPTDKSQSTPTRQVQPVFKTDTWKTPLIFGKASICPDTNRGNKNLQFFIDPSDGAAVAELYPGKQKTAMNLSQPCPASVIGPRLVDLTSPAVRSFGTLDELHFWNHGVHLYNHLLTTERGSACCTPIQRQGKHYLLGISHSKFRFRNKKTRHSLPGNVSANHFFSSFYAMQAEPPYTVVALSGKFCLGFGDEKEVATQNPYARSTTTRRLRLGNEYFDCPAIHFVSGMTDTPDGEHLIIAYGVGDCSPRMVKVRKDDVLSLLFPYDAEDD